MPEPSGDLRLDGISKAYPGVVAIERVSLTLHSGEVHALVGENGAGKSTLMGVLYGLIRADEGRVIVAGRSVAVPSPRHARSLGIGLVQQHFSLIPTLTAAENLVLALRGTGRVRNAGQARVLLAHLGERYGLTIDADTPVELLPVSQQQRAEVLKALAADVKVLALDEPNALLTPSEWAQLAQVLRRLAESGVAVMLISHKLDDVIELADRISVLRRGRLVATMMARDTTASQLGALMVGPMAAATAGGVSRPTTVDEVRLEVSDLTVEDDGRSLVRDVSLSLRSGEIVGLAGVEGSGQVELIEALAGVRRCSAGRISHGGLDVTRHDALARRRDGVGYVPADRLATGLIASLTVAENLLLPAIGDPPLSRAGLISRRMMGTRAQELIDEYDIRVGDSTVLAGQLSGGNQQKMVLARELSRRPDVLLCCYATRGLDFSATDAVRRRVLETRDAGAAVLYASVDLDELLELADRVIVMHGGTVVGEVDCSVATPELLGSLMGGRRLAS